MFNYSELLKVRKYISTNCMAALLMILSLILLPSSTSKNTFSISKEEEKLKTIKLPDVVFTQKIEYQIINDFDTLFHFSYVNYTDSVHRRESIDAGGYSAINPYDAGSPSYGKYQMKWVSIYFISRVYNFDITISEFMSTPYKQEICYGYYTLWHYDQIKKKRGYCTPDDLHLASAYGIGGYFEKF